MAVPGVGMERGGKRISQERIDLSLLVKKDQLWGRITSRALQCLYLINIPDNSQGTNKVMTQ